MIQEVEALDDWGANWALMMTFFKAYVDDLYRSRPCSTASEVLCKGLSWGTYRQWLLSFAKRPHKIVQFLLRIRATGIC